MCLADMPGKLAAATFLTFHYIFTREFSRRGNVNYVIYDAEGACEDQYGSTRGLIWVHLRASMGSCEWAVMDLESRAVSASSISLGD